TLHVGEDRFVQLEPTKLDFENLVIEVPKMFADGFLKWRDETSNATKPVLGRKATIEYRAPGSDTSYFGGDLTGMTIVSASMVENRLKAILAFDGMSFRVGGAAIR